MTRTARRKPFMVPRSSQRPRLLQRTADRGQSERDHLHFQATCFRRSRCYRTGKAHPNECSSSFSSATGQNCIGWYLPVPFHNRTPLFIIENTLHFRHLVVQKRERVFVAPPVSVPLHTDHSDPHAREMPRLPHSLARGKTDYTNIRITLA